MKIPKELPILGKVIEIKIIDEPENDACGEFDGDDLLTLNTAKNSDPEMIHTIVHEIGHAIFVRAGFRQGIPIALEEAIVQSYANVITELFELKFKNKKKIGVPL
jgi:hypothetical protein